MDRRLKGLLTVWLLLLALLGATFGLSFLPWGAWGNAASLGIAAAKAALIVTVFMRLGASQPLVRLAAGAGLFWLTILMALTLADVLTRV
ncbi:cytochrome C oxidase subunit IV family protein [Azospirillum doebereinerae]|uniref:Oxidase n=1 Tax=Azospirillum doebereinerae TaxID=92933 RepID=A0A433J4K0_9PROT|nr:cytochrome C oxidase subunit IV family protein [Azospirillum doebereinerae]MCG5239722.1 cytochrome C oxidase subunit IV family protein [Azospirillum doebereinerae]RUQ67117.1 oxidase [Azospirillum doebereinerae]